MIESRTLTSYAVPGHAPRLDAIHCLRGLAALAVCLLHVSVATTHHFPDSITTIGNLGGFGVPVFFVISGFVVPLSLLGSGYTIRSFPRFVLRRVTRLDPPYFAVLALALLSAYAVRLMRDTPFPYRFSDVALHVGYLTGLASRPWIVSTFWTLGIEFQYYLLVGLALAVALPIARRLTTPSWRGPILIGLLIAGFLLSSEAGRRLHALITDTQMTATWFVFKNDFLLGTAALIVWRARMSPLVLIAVGALFFGVDGVEYWYYYRRLPNSPVILEWVTLVVIACLIVVAPTSWNWMRNGTGRAAAGLGTISYSLYITHPLLTGHLVARLVETGKAPTSLVGNWALVLVEVGLCVAAAAIFYWLVERPAWRWSRRLSIRPPDGSRAGARFRHADGLSNTRKTEAPAIRPA